MSWHEPRSMQSCGHHAATAITEARQVKLRWLCLAGTVHSIWQSNKLAVLKTSTCAWHVPQTFGLHRVAAAVDHPTTCSWDNPP